MPNRVGLMDVRHVDLYSMSDMYDVKTREALSWVDLPKARNFARWQGFEHVTDENDEQSEEFGPRGHAAQRTSRH
jgi:hypothetical protein